MADHTDAQRLAEASDIIVGVVENGPWVLITDPQLQQIIGEYVADTCHSVASAAGLDEAMERAHDAMPQRLARSLPGQRVAPDARERLARHLYMKGSTLESKAGQRWDVGSVCDSRMDDYRRAADDILAVITGQET